MQTLEKLAIANAIQDATWLKTGMFFKQISDQLRGKLLQECLDQNNVAAFEELLLNLRQESLVIQCNHKFTDNFALTVVKCIENNSAWQNTRINKIDFGGCDIGPEATRKFCSIALEQNRRGMKAKTNGHSFFTQELQRQNWHEEKVNFLKICINLHIKRDTFDDICCALTEKPTILIPYGIEADDLGREHICKLLDILHEKASTVYVLDFYMNSLGKDGVVDVCIRLSNFRNLRRLDLSLAMISDEDREAAIEISKCLHKMPLLESLNLSANILKQNFSFIFNSLPNSILRLDLSYCGLLPRETVVLAERLKSSSIRSLYLQYNTFGTSEGFQALLLLLDSCKMSLKKLDISNVGLVYDTASRLLHFLEDNKQTVCLKWLGIDNVAIRTDELLWENMKMALPMTVIEWKSKDC